MNYMMNEKSISKQIRLGAIISYVAIFISILSALFYTPWMKNQIGDAQYALYTLVGSIVSLFLVDFGLSSSATRFIAKYRTDNDQQSINDILGYIFKLYIFIDMIIIVALVIFYFCIDDIYTGLNVSEREILKKIYLIFGSYSVLAFPCTPLSGVLNAFERFVELKLCDLFQKLLTIVLIVVALFCGGNIVVLISMNAVAGILAIAFKFLIINSKHLVRPNFFAKNKNLLSDLLHFSIWVTVLALAERMIFSVAPTILGVTSNSIEIARFAPASQLEGYFFTFAFAINGLFLPTVARYEQEEKEESFEQLMIGVGRYQIIILGLLFTGVCVLAPDFVELWMGPSYRISGYCTILLIFPSLMQYPQQIIKTLMSVRNKVKFQAIIALAIGCINILLSFLLTPKYGALGSSISIMVAYFISFVLLNIVYNKALKLNLVLFYKKVYIRYLPLIVGCIVSSYMLCHFVTLSGWLALVIKCAICIFVYGSIIFILGLSGEERRSLFKKIRNNPFVRKRKGE